MYIPDWSFEKRLKGYDPLLSVRWAAHKERWEILRDLPNRTNTYRRKAVIMTIQNEDGSYRGLDERVLEDLRRCDGHRVGAKQLMDQLDEEQDRLDAAKHKAFSSQVEAISREIAPQAIKEFPALTRNIPKEDVRKMLIQRYGEEQAADILAA